MECREESGFAKKLCAINGWRAYRASPAYDQFPDPRQIKLNFELELATGMYELMMDGEI